MAQVTALLESMKQCLKAKNVTYADVGKALDLSEASVKRMFSKQHVSLQRLDAICTLIDMEISDIVRHMNDAQDFLDGLTYVQEDEIARDHILILVTVCVFNGWTLKQITDFFIVSEEACISRLLKLDQLRVIDLMPCNRIKLLVSSNFKWIKNGPFEQFFREHIGQDYFNSNFEGESQYLSVLNGTLCDKSAIEFQRKLQKLGREFVELIREDANKPFEDKNGVTLVMAMRNWDYGMFRHLIRK